jgi:cyclic pyranopterin phosphate synthase
MPIGECVGWSRERFVGSSKVLEAVPGLIEAGADGVARLYRLPGCRGTVGLISPISGGFCPLCNRIRVTADGKLRPCLHGKEEIGLRGLHGRDLEAAVRSAVSSKPQGHHLCGAAPAQNPRGSGGSRNMNSIGG